MANSDPGPGNEDVEIIAEEVTVVSVHQQPGPSAQSINNSAQEPATSAEIRSPVIDLELPNQPIGDNRVTEQISTEEEPPSPILGRRRRVQGNIMQKYCAAVF